MRVPRRVFALIVAGGGLILIGGAAMFQVSRARVDDATQPTDFSAIPASVHFDAPPLTLIDLDGMQHSLSDYPGQVVLINLWATWCPPCKAEMPILQGFYEAHRREGFTVLAIDDGDPKADVLSFVDRYALTFPVWLDPTYQGTDRAFRTKNLPSSYVMDRNGLIKLEWLGAISETNLEKYIIPYLKEE